MQRTCPAVRLSHTLSFWRRYVNCGFQQSVLYSTGRYNLTSKDRLENVLSKLYFRIVMFVPERLFAWSLLNLLKQSCMPEMAFLCVSDLCKGLDVLFRLCIVKYIHWRYSWLFLVYISLCLLDKQADTWVHFFIPCLFFCLSICLSITFWCVGKFKQVGFMFFWTWSVYYHCLEITAWIYADFSLNISKF